MFWTVVLSVCFYFSLVVSEQCPEYSTYVECGCMLTCENPYPTEDCFRNCESGCNCNPGYFLRSDGQCVLLTQCKISEEYQPNTPDKPNIPDTSYQCDQDEQYYDCTPTCKNTCENLNDQEAQCKCGPPSCFCREGLVKRGDGKCVPPQDCEDQCGQDEQYYDCTPTCKNTCENINDQEAQCKCGPPSCFCREGLVRRGDGKCVPPQECEVSQPDCPPNAIYIPCGSACAPTCEDPRIRSCGNECVAACFCKPGYLLSKDEKMCVKQQHCNLKDIPVPPEPKCPEYAVYIQCGSACAPTCKNLYPEPCGDECVSACFCIPGYLMTNNGTKCVRQDQCDTVQKPPPTNDRCGAGEKYYKCTPSCKNTCKNFYKPGVDCGCGPPGCFCCEGLVKREDGKCVQPNQCPVTPTKCVGNAVFVPCGSSCPPTCDNPNPQPCSQRCVPGCFCKEGFLQTKEGKCVLPQQCEKQYPSKCPEHAVYQECGTSCPKTCEDPYPSRCTLECVAGCFCKPGFLKRKDGKCVIPQQCDGKIKTERCGADEQYYECTPSCKNTCNNYNNPGGPLCRCGPPGCFCREGLVKREDGKCVLPNQCPSRCAANEQYYECTPNCKNTCQNYNNPGVNCGCGPPGCFCSEGLVKREDGKCVQPNQCPVAPTKCVENAVFVPCGSSCPPTCDYPNPQPCSQRCVPGCFCKRGFLQTKEGKCVLPQQCEKSRCAADEQYYECTPRCKNTCKNYNNPGVDCGCGPPGCFCREGLVKREDGKCVRPNQCPVTPPKCMENAVFLPCGSPCPPTCDRPIPIPCPQRCVAGCFCKHGFLLTKDGKCVPPQQCEKKNVTRCLENAEHLDCGPACPETCENTQPRKPCIAACFPGCFCKPGFVKTKDGNCVLPSLCDKKCSLPEEEYVECGSTCPDTCDNKGQTPPGGCPNKCVRGCFCKKGLFRDLKGACVAPKDCPGQMISTSAETRRSNKNPEYGVTFGESRGCPDQKLCEAFCKSHKLNAGYCVGTDNKECHCS